jgi:hypothetical protein
MQEQPRAISRVGPDAPRPPSSDYFQTKARLRLLSKHLRDNSFFTQVRTMKVSQNGSAFLDRVLLAIGLECGALLYTAALHSGG